MKILNLTQHVATPEQSAAGVFEPSNKDAIRKELTFADIPDDDMEIYDRARRLAFTAKGEAISAGVKSGERYAMIGGAPFLMPVLEQLLRAKGIVPLYAFSRRESVERTLPDGSVEKINNFVHVGFVEGLEL